MAQLDNIITGSFTSDGAAKLLQIRSDLDYFECTNYTQMATQAGTGVGVRFEWYRGMAADTGVEYKKTNSTDALNGVTLASGGFTLVDSTQNIIGSAVAVTSVSNAAIPIVATGTTTGLVAGDIVRLINIVGGQQISGVDFTIDTIVASTSFRLPYMAQVAAGTTGFYRKINYQPQFYPRARYITAVTTGATTVVKMSVTHGYTVGQRVSFVVPAAFGMTQLNSLDGQILSIDTTNNTITVNINSSAFTAFAFPVSASVPFTFAQVVPFGDAPLTLANPQGNQSVLDGATYNTAYIGIQLAGGAQSPAGQANDVIYWKALKASQVQS